MAIKTSERDALIRSMTASSQSVSKKASTGIFLGAAWLSVGAMNAVKKLIKTVKNRVGSRRVNVLFCIVLPPGIRYVARF